MKLDWSKIDTWQKFQRLVNALFELEMNSTNFQPSDPDIGDDGGKDGIIRQDGNYLEKRGTFLIQSKYHKIGTQPKAAFDQIKAELKKKEFDNYKRNKANCLFLCINVTLNTKIDYREALEKYANENKINMIVCDKEWLTLKIERQPFLKLYYFSSQIIPLFLPPPIYFKESKESLFVKTINEINTIQEKVAEFKAFLKDDNKQIFIIDAFGGHGKSHLLRELPGVTHDICSEREVWFIKSVPPDIRQAFNEEIGSRESSSRKHKYLFILDDADRVENIKNLVSSIIQSGIDVKLVMALRTAGKFSVREELTALRYLSFCTFTSIGRWTDEELKILLRTVSGKDQGAKAEDIVRRYPNPFFIVKIGQNIKGQKTQDITPFILELVVGESKKALSSKNIDVENLLLHLALISPINISYASTIEKLAEKLNIDKKELIAILQKLDEVGVMRNIDSIWRFVPDMLGDIFLLEKMKKLKSFERRDTFLYWFETHSKNIFTNLGATFMYGGQKDSEFLPEIVSDVISGWSSKAKKYDDYEKRRILENLEEICLFIPEKALDLLWVFIGCSDLSTDAYGPVVLRLIRSNCARDEIVKLIEEIREKVREGTYGNYKFDTLAQETVTPLKNSISNIIEILGLLEGLLKDNEKIVNFTKAALREVLASAHEHTESNYKGMTFGAKVLKVTDPVLNMRNKAIDIVKMMLTDNRVSLRLASIEIIEDIGKGCMGSGASGTPLSDKINEEEKEMLQFISDNNLIGEEKDWRVLSAYEDLLFHWWASYENIPDDIVVPLLRKFVYGPEYRIYRYYSSRWDVTENILEKLKDAPSKKERWKWAVDNIMQRKWHLTPDDFDEDAKILKKIYSDPVNIVSFLNNLEKNVEISSAGAPFLRAWFKQDPESFKKIRMEEELWKQIPFIFKYTITYALVQEYPEIAKIIIDKVLLVKNIDTNEAKVAIDILSYDVQSLDKVGVIKEVVEKNIDDLNLNILERVRFIGDKLSAKVMADIVLIIFGHLSDHVLSKAIDHVSFVLHNKSSEYVRELISITHEALCKAILNNGKLDYHDFEIAVLLFPEAENLLKFIEARLEKEKEINKYSEYEAVPYDGVMFIEKIINDVTAYFFAVNQVLAWNEKYGGISNYSVEKLFKQIVLLKDASGKMYFECIKDRFYSKDDFMRFLECLFHLPLIKANIDIFKEAINKSNTLGFDAEMSNLLKGKIYPEGGWSSSVGETPPIFIEKKNVFQELKDNAPQGILRSGLDDCIRGVEKMIEDHMKDEENRFYSR
jgi:hypothetical protein